MSSSGISSAGSAPRRARGVKPSLISAVLGLARIAEIKMSKRVERSQRPSLTCPRPHTVTWWALAHDPTVTRNLLHNAKDICPHLSVPRSSREQRVRLRVLKSGLDLCRGAGMVLAYGRPWHYHSPGGPPSLYGLRSPRATQLALTLLKRLSLSLYL